MTLNLFGYPNQDYLTYKEVSEVLGVSTATVRNWVKLGHIEPAAVHLSDKFLSSHVEDIRNKITHGSLAKLNARANKGNSISKIIPTEYADNREVFEPLLKITELIKKYNFAYDDRQTLTLNSANVLIPTISNYPIKTILALFNSTLYQFIFEKKFGAIKVLRSHIEQLPLPDISKREHMRFEKLVDELLKKDLGIEERKSLYKKLDDEVMSLFSLDEQEKKRIYNGVSVSDKLLEIN
jgi:hypothetical protein